MEPPMTATEIQAAPTTIEEKTRELCECIVEDAVFTSAQGKIEAFLGDDDAKTLYRDWQQQAEMLHQKHHQGEEASPEELAELKAREEKVMSHPVGADFVAAEDTMNRLFQSVTRMVQKTLQNGEVPSPEEMEECCGNSGCGCH